MQDIVQICFCSLVLLEILHIFLNFIHDPIIFKAIIFTMKIPEPTFTRWFSSCALTKVVLHTIGCFSYFRFKFEFMQKIVKSFFFPSLFQRLYIFLGNLSTTMIFKTLIYIATFLESTLIHSFTSSPLARFVQKIVQPLVSFPWYF